jgi:UDP-GlcNAc:undecaprenyl-phosphate/decaprenyl-phosphate GlcNAc-1-phosphate transferase
MEVVYLKSGICAFLISVIFTPFIIRLSHKKGFFASLNHRSSHVNAIPNTGGIILCFAIIAPLIIFSSYPQQSDFSLLLSAFAVLLITGVIDDFNPIPVVFKFLGQFIPAIVIVTSIDERELVIPFIEQFNLPGVFNYLFWIIFIVMSINAFNLIDGIDGLAISLGMTGGVFYLIKFLYLQEANMVIFTISLVGGLAGLLLFNLSRKNKIFIGDTGSLMIGGLLAFFGLKFINISEPGTASNSFFLVIGIIFLPFMDMVRVALVRIYRGDSPFKADRNHLHHHVLKMSGRKHIIATGIIVSAQVVIVLLFQAISFQKSFNYLFVIIGASIIYFLVLLAISNRSVKRKN